MLWPPRRLQRRRGNDSTIASARPSRGTPSSAKTYHLLRRSDGYMNIGVGLPTSTAGISGQLLVDWARRADARPLRSPAVVDPLAYPQYEPLTALAAAPAGAPPGALGPPRV